MNLLILEKVRNGDYVDIKNTYFSETIPQIWDELRRKVSDIQNQLPPGAGPVMVNDDFGDVYNGRTYRLYRRFLSYCLHRRTLSLVVLIGLLVAAVYGFGFVENAFFPNDNRNQFMIDYWRPQGTHITKTEADMEKIGQYLAGLDEVTATTAFIGQGALRFMLSYEPQMPNTSYGQFLVTVKDYRSIDTLMPKVWAHLVDDFPDAEIIMKKFVRGPDRGGKIEARFSGPDIVVLRELSEQTRRIMASDPVATDIRDNWRQQIPIVRPQIESLNLPQGYNLVWVGVTIGLLIFDEPFGFMCILGFLGLSGSLFGTILPLLKLTSRAPPFSLSLSHPPLFQQTWTCFSLSSFSCLFLSPFFVFISIMPLYASCSALSQCKYLKDLFC